MENISTYCRSRNTLYRRTDAPSAELKEVMPFAFFFLKRKEIGIKITKCFHWHSVPLWGGGLERKQKSNCYLKTFFVITICKFWLKLSIKITFFFFKRLFFAQVAIVNKNVLIITCLVVKLRWHWLAAPPCGTNWYCKEVRHGPSWTSFVISLTPCIDVFMAAVSSHPVESFSSFLKVYNVFENG